jgi:hypothetical protein
MKKVLLSLAGCLISFQCFANPFQELGGKLYVSPGSVYVAPNAIYVNTGEGFVLVEGIACDDNGVYIQGHECRVMLCLRCAQVHDNRQPCPKR